MNDWSKLAFITHIRVDTPQRLENYKCVVDYYRSYGDNAQFILVEDDATPNSALVKSLSSIFHENDIHTFMANKMEYRRPLAYNIGANITERPVLCFLDTDVLVHPSSVEMTKNCLSDATFDVMWPYNGTAIYTTEMGRALFMKEPRVETLITMLPPNSQLFQTSPYMRVEHTQAKGAIIMQRRQSFVDTGGFNIDFVGWGYEDDEYEVRMRKFNQKLGRCLGKHEVFFHLHHPRTQANASANPEHPFLQHNMGLLQAIRDADMVQIGEWMDKQKAVVKQYLTPEKK